MASAVGQFQYANEISAKYIRTIYRRAPLSPCTNLYREQKSKAKQGSNDGDKARLLISKPEIQKARITNALRVSKKSWPRELDEAHEKKGNPQLNGEPANGNWLGISLQYTHTHTYTQTPTHTHVEVFPGRDFFFSFHSKLFSLLRLLFEPAIC